MDQLELQRENYRKKVAAVYQALQPHLIDLISRRDGRAEIRRRFRVFVWSYARNVIRDPLVDDKYLIGEIERIDQSKKLGNVEMDSFFANITTDLDAISFDNISDCTAGISGHHAWRSYELLLSKDKVK